MLKIVYKIVRTGILTEPAPAVHSLPEVSRIHHELLHILGRALCIRQVDAGSCNGCELEIHALNNPYYNLEGYGIKFVASPRHADLLMVTGPVSRNMEMALKRTYEATPDPKLVLAVGDCGRVANVIQVDLTVAGCPPAPVEILRAVLGLARRLR